MRSLICLGLLTLSLNGQTVASEIQTLSGNEAYQMYLNLPGKACQEYRLASYVVYTKYQTNSCTEIQTDNSKWTCTVQLTLKNGKQTGVMSADCSRQI